MSAGLKIAILTISNLVKGTMVVLTGGTTQKGNEVKRR